MHGAPPAKAGGAFVVLAESRKRKLEVQALSYRLRGKTMPLPKRLSIERGGLVLKHRAPGCARPSDARNAVSAAACSRIHRGRVYMNAPTDCRWIAFLRALSARWRTTRSPQSASSADVCRLSNATRTPFCGRPRNALIAAV
jgi:hypothetical protein